MYARVIAVMDRARDRDALIKRYFLQGYEYKFIVQFLQEVHGIAMSIRTLKRILARLNLRKRKALDSGELARVKRLIKVKSLNLYVCVSLVECILYL